MSYEITEANRLDEKGRCCGWKPLVYKRHNSADLPAGYFCPRCDRAFDKETGAQIHNWAYTLLPDGTFRRKIPDGLSDGPLLPRW